MAIFNPTLEQIARLKTKPTEGEQTLLKFLEQTLDNSYEVFFQPHINGDLPDIVIMRKNAGVMIIEVKDWDLDHYSMISRHEWQLKNIMNPYSKRNQVVMSPMRQVENYKKNLYNLHIDDLIEKNVKNSQYYSMINSIVYLHKANTFKIERFLGDEYEKIVKYCDVIGYDSLVKEKFDEILYKRYMKISSSKLFDREMYKKFSRVLQPINHTLEEGKVFHYSSDQKKIVESKAKNKQKVRGVAGGGKTRALAQRAVNAYKRTDKEVLILTFNISLRNYIHDMISDVRENFPWRNFTILNYHAFIKAYCTNNNLHFPKPFFEDDTQELPAFPQKYQTIIVDEIQDYKKAWVKNIHSLLDEDGEVVFLGDEKQNIYKRDMDQKENRPYTGIVGNWTTFKTSQRMESEIIPIADAFQKEFLIKKYEYDQIISEMSLQFKESSTAYYHMNVFDAKEIIKIYQNIIQKHTIHDNEVCFLSVRVEPLRSLEQSIRKQLSIKTKVMFETQELYDEIMSKHTKEKAQQIIDAIRRSRKFNFWMNSGETKLSTIHSFKGWEIPTLILIIEKNSDEESDVNNVIGFTSDELIYTAITRCKENLIIINLGNDKYHDFFKGNITNHHEIIVKNNIPRRRWEVEDGYVFPEEEIPF